ncbi:hypothetical protein ASNO1_30430 [Corallococcus caeni]|uniref:Uncharacterized protein n=1 Tax=Corallococcus caeni TaxID=3082388 RepID=A0ABQ6QRZ1_9BACT|nr:hypothetical protein ASNO1_30430 [Corallococcus sp. NO1]
MTDDARPASSLLVETHEPGGKAAGARRAGCWRAACPTNGQGAPGDGRGKQERADCSNPEQRTRDVGCSPLAGTRAATQLVEEGRPADRAAGATRWRGSRGY